LTVRATRRLVVPLPLVRLVNVTVSAYWPAARLLALELMETVTVVAT
jgi:hypothetical protein